MNPRLFKSNGWQSRQLKVGIAIVLFCLFLLQTDWTLLSCLQLLITTYFLMAHTNIIVDAILIALSIVILINQYTTISELAYSLLVCTILLHHLQKYLTHQPAWDSLKPEGAVENMEHERNPIEVCLLDSFPSRLHTLPSYTFITEQLQKRSCFIGQATYKFMRAISNNYNRVPYHNITHGLCVAYTLHRYLGTMQNDLCLTDAEYCTMLIAAYCHDVGHQGKSNNYYSRKGHQLAEVYFHNGVLEHYHCSVTFRVARKHDIFSLLPERQRAAARKLVVRCILATDMANHHSHVRQLKAVQKNPDYSEDARELIQEQLVHAADISTNTMPFEISERWRRRIYEQFHEEQCELSGKVKPMPAERQQHVNTIAFIDLFCMPMFKELSRLNDCFQEAVDQLERNRKRREQLI